MSTRSTQHGKQRDFFDWVSVAVSLVQVSIYVGAAIAALYWYVSRGGGLSAVIVGLTVSVLGLVACIGYELTVVRRSQRDP